MGVINVTPDSFSVSSRVSTPREALDKARFLIDSGADLLDIGAESTRPGFTPLTTEEERHRLLPVLDTLSGLSIPLSLDTRNPVVMREAMAYAPSIINDTGGLESPSFTDLLIEHPNLWGVVMHGAGSGVSSHPQNLSSAIVPAVSDFFRDRLSGLTTAGVAPDRLLFDPGIGFGKNTRDNLELIRNIHTLLPGFPLLLGVSRKRFLGEVTGEEVPEHRDPQTLAVLAATFNRISLFRVHDVKGAVAFRTMLVALGEGTSDAGA